MCVNGYLYKHMLIHKHIWKKILIVKKMPHHTFTRKKLKTSF